MCMKKTSGQGSLEYLLLVAGAVLVSAIVIVLLLNLNSSSSGQANSSTLASLCINSATANWKEGTVGLDRCIDKDGSTVGLGTNSIEQRKVWLSKCYNCTGVYPRCVAGTTTTDTQANCS